MTSLLCRKQEGGLVKVHNQDTVKKLVTEGDKLTQVSQLNRQLTENRRLRQASCGTSAASRSNSCCGTVMQLKELLGEKTVKDEANRMAGVKAVREVLQPLWEGEESTKDIHDYLERQKMLNLRKKENLHKTWMERVYIPMRKKVIEAVDKGDWMEVKRRREELHQQYIELVNRKGHVYLDTMDPTEYYAMALHDNRPAPVVSTRERLCRQLYQKALIRGPQLRVEVDRIRDPLLSQGRDRNEEDRTILRLATGYRFTDDDLNLIRRPRYPLVPLGRQGSDSIKWVAMPLSQMETRPRRNMLGFQLVHNADFGKWAKEERNPEVIQQELSIQRKRKFTIHPPYRPRPPGYARRSYTAPPMVDVGVNTSLESTYASDYLPNYLQRRAELMMQGESEVQSSYPPVALEPVPSQMCACPEFGEPGAILSNTTTLTPHNTPATEAVASVD